MRRAGTVCVALVLLCAVVVQAVGGDKAQTRGRRVVILGGIGLFVTAVALYLTIRAISPLAYAVRVLDGAATAMWYTALFTYAADLVPVERRTEGLAVFGISGLVALGLGALGGEVILEYTTYRGLFVWALILAALGLALCTRVRDIPLADAESHESARHVLATAVQRNLLPIWLAAMAFFIAMAAVFAFIKTFVGTTGVGTVGTFFSAYAAVAVALRAFAGRLPERLGARRTAGMAMACFAAGLAVLSSAQSAGPVIVAGLLCGAGHGYTFPVLLSLVVERARARERGAATALFTTLDWLGLLMAGPFVGLAIERMGYRFTFMGLSLLIAVGIGLFYGLDRDFTKRTESDRTVGTR